MQNPSDDSLNVKVLACTCSMRLNIKILQGILLSCIELGSSLLHMELKDNRLNPKKETETLVFDNTPLRFNRIHTVFSKIEIYFLSLMEHNHEREALAELSILLVNGNIIVYEKPSHKCV